jgi:hypothetical protein
MLSVRTLQPVRSKVAVPARATRGVAAPRSVVVRASLRESQGATVALASTAAMLLLSFGAADAAVAESFGKDPVSALVAQTQKIQDVKTKPGICDRKACKIYPGDDGFICRTFTASTPAVDAILELYPMVAS